MMRALFLAVFLASVAQPAFAQDNVLRAVDDLMAAERFDAALALLDHAAGSPAELAGRRGLCEAALGRSTEAATHIAEAIRSSSDPWVTENRARLLAALSAAPQAPSQVPAPVPLVAPLPIETATSVPSAQGLSPVHFDEGFNDRFGRELPEDVPLRRVPTTVEGSRLIVRGLVSIGAVVTRVPSLGTSPYQNGPYSYNGYAEPGSSTYSFQGRGYGYFDEDKPQSSSRFDLGAEVEGVLSGRLSLIGALELGIGIGGMQDVSVETRTVLGRTGSTTQYDASEGPVDWSPTFGLRTTASLRFHVGSGRALVGVGGRFGLARVHGHADLVDGVATYYETDDDNRPTGAPEGTFDRWAGGPTVEALFDVGGAIGPRRDGLIFLRLGAGAPLFTAQLVVAIPLFRSAP